jgi:diguanylate cyclase (GGDEF)-like protein
LALLFIDLDHFKEVNDLLGHDAGDLILVQAASRIVSCVRESDTVARLGGDEFTTILTELDTPFDAENIASKINQALAVPFLLGEESLHLTASIGITLYPTDGTEPDQLTRHADQAMYVAKSNGRDQFNYYTAALQSRAQDRLRLIADLRHALCRNELEVYYQPVVNLRTGRIGKAEALLRWNHPRRGFLTPASFVPFAEESGLISDIGDWVFRQAAASCKKWRDLADPSFQVSINRSPVQFMARSSGGAWTSYLADLGLSGQAISVEITEAVLLNMSGRVTQQLEQYRGAGMQVAIDDFGTGYSSLAYLKKLDIDYLKIDQTFVRDMQQNDDDCAIVRSVTAMAHELGLRVIAEGVETVEQVELLLAAGCDYGQGYYFSRPMPFGQFEHMLLQHRA